MTSSSDQIREQIFEYAKKQAEVEEALMKFAEEVRDYWRSISPVDEGDYAASVKVSKRKITVDGMPAKRVGAYNYKAHWIEYGTGEPGKTTAEAPRAKTVSRFGGDETRARIDASPESTGDDLS